MNREIDGRLKAIGADRAEVEERFVRGSGPGGQKINKTSSSVWLRHAPTGIEVRCQRERSQLANREIAWFELIARLEGKQKAQRNAAVDALETERRRTRQKSRGQKIRMIESKKHRARTKGNRGRRGFD